MNEAVRQEAFRAGSEKQRLVSLDVFRGITIIFMIIVNNPGNPRAIYPALEHAAWHGLTPTDLVFPSFLFISGVSVAFALAGRKANAGLTWSSFGTIAKRGLTLVLLGILIHSIPGRYAWSSLTFHDFFAYMRYPGVLQRIGLVYIAAASLFLACSRNSLVWIAAGLLVVYYLAMQFLPVPGVAPANFERALNLEAYLDRLLIGTEHLYRSTLFWDPEGILSTLPSISTALLGILAGYTLRDGRTASIRLKYLLYSGLLYLGLGIIWSFAFPLNKNLWSSSFVLVAAGISSLLLGICYFLVDIKQYRRGIKPLLYYGMNSILAYAVAESLETLLNYFRLPGPGDTTVGLFTFVYLHAFHPLPVSAETSSALWSLVYALLFAIPLGYFYRRKIFLKV